MARDISQETLKVGNALASVRIDEMITNLAKGIAWGQYELDQVGVNITKMMGAPGTVSIGGEQISMLEAGFTPSFYHFVDTILEMKMEVNIREEEASSTSVSTKTSRENERSSSYKFSASGSANLGFFKMKASASGGGSTKSKSAYSRAVDSTQSQKYSQDLSASSLMRTKIVPIPPPEILLERIKILLEKLRKEAEEAETASEQEALGLEKLNETKLFSLSISTDGINEEALDNPTKDVNGLLYEAFSDQEDYDLLKSMTITKKDSEEAGGVTVKKWIVKDKIENKYIISLTQEIDKDDIMAVHSGGQTQNSAFAFDDLFDLDVPQ
ncbi:hypothetical protein [Ekhidna sp.]|uniref:hypothetical protein n=1 Tax=Ekhidna sp. TaxID=2608089 RepID=UPI003297044E